MWYWLAPPFRDSFAQRLQTDRVLLGLADSLVTLPGLDGAELLRKGCVKDWVWQRGQLLGVVHLEVLVAENRTEELRRCLEVLPASEEGRTFLKLAAQGTDRTLTFLLFAAYGPMRGVRNRLRSQDRTSPRELCAAAKAWKLVLGDEAEALDLLTRAEQQCRSPGDRIMCGEALAAVMGDQQGLVRCLEAAEALRQQEQDPSRRALHALSCAVAWKTLAADDQAALRDLQEAVSASSEDSALLRAAATTWRTLFPDEESAVRCLESAEAQVKGAKDLTACAALRIDVFGEEPASAVGRCLQSAEAQARSVADWVLVAALWRADMGDEAQGRRCMQAAESLCKDGADWLALGQGWKWVFGDSAEERRCMLNELDMRAGLDLSVRARGWLEIFVDQAEPRQRMKEAETKFLSRGEWESASAVWKEVFKDEVEAQRCLEEAERYHLLEKSLGEGDWPGCARIWKTMLPEGEAQRRFQSLEAGRGTLRDLVSFAAAWKEVFLDEAEARRCLRGAEAQATSASAWIALGAAWRTVIGDDGEGRRCMAAAEAGVTAAADLVLVATVWEQDFQDQGEAQRLRLRELTERAGDDLVVLARGWKEIFPDQGEARRRVKEAEAKAVSAADYKRFAQLWQDVFEDQGEADRCQGEADRLQKLDEALEAGQWLACARIWLEVLGSGGNAEERFRSLEERAKTLQDYVAFAEGWKLVFDREEDARRCMKEAESKVRFRSDWKLCAEAWRQIGDFMEAERCSR